MTGEHEKSSSYSPPSSFPIKGNFKGKPRYFCCYCDSKEHFLGGCPQIKSLSQDRLIDWIKKNDRCFKCGRKHKPDECTLKKPCHSCKDTHLTILHDVVKEFTTGVHLSQTTDPAVYLDKPTRPQKVMLKVVPLYIYGTKRMEAYAILDDGSERTMVLPSIVEDLKLEGTKETMYLRTVRDDIVECSGQCVSLQVSPIDQPDVKYDLQDVFSSSNLCLSEYTYPVKKLQQHYPHLKNVVLPLIHKSRPVILIGSDYSDLIVPSQARWGPNGAPIAVQTKLGWALQGPVHSTKRSGEQRCYATSILSESSDTMQHVERLWQADVLPYANERQVTRSKQDHKALQILESRTQCVEDNGIRRYATPLLRKQDGTRLHAPMKSVLPVLNRTERYLEKDNEKAKKHNELIQKLVDAGYVEKLTKEEAETTPESWYFPHHVVHHNGKYRLVFNCSFPYHGQVLNKHLMPGPALGPSLIGVLLRFRQHAIAISGDIKAMFHQVLLLPEDRPLLRFIWRNQSKEHEPDIYEWRVLPFGTTCSPCCAIFALQRHALDNKVGNEAVTESVEKSFYVDNCLDSLPNSQDAKALIHNMRKLLKDGGFEIRQWASNDPSVIKDLPPAARSDGCELWLTFGNTEPSEATLGFKEISKTAGMNGKVNCLNFRVSRYQGATHHVKLTQYQRDASCMSSPTHRNECMVRSRT